MASSKQPSAVKRRTIGAIAVVFIFGPYLFLASPNTPQASGRTLVLATWAFAVPIAILWFGLKGQMLRPGAKLYQAKYDESRPTIVRGIRLVVLGFGVFYLLVLSLPIGEDLTRAAATHAFLRVRASVVNVGGSSYHSVSLTVTLSDDSKGYSLFYPIKPLKIGQSYEFVLLPHSRMILDYNPTK